MKWIKASERLPEDGKLVEIKTDTKIQTIVESIQDMPGIANITTHINSNPYELYIQRIMKK